MNPIYETGSVLRECGVLSGYDMTVEAALTKLSYVLGKDEWTLETKKQVKCVRRKLVNKRNFFSAIVDDGTKYQRGIDVWETDSGF